MRHIGCFLHIVVIGTVAAGLASCDKPKEELPSAPPGNKNFVWRAPVAPEDNSLTPLPGSSLLTMKTKNIDQVFRPDIPVELTKSLSRYRATRDADERSDIVQDVAALGTSGPEAVAIADTLGQMFAMEQDEDIKTDILNDLAQLETPSAFDQIMKGVDSGQPEAVQEAAKDALVDFINTLAMGDEPHAFDQIIRGLDPKFPEEVRQAAVDALGILGDARAVPVLQPLLADDSPEIRESAQTALEVLAN